MDVSVILLVREMAGRLVLSQVTEKCNTSFDIALYLRVWLKSNIVDHLDSAVR